MAVRRFGLIYAPQVKRHLKAIESKHYSLIRRTIETQLQHGADVETRNRKPLKRPILDATWEIRFGPDNRLRVFYKIDHVERKVMILAIGQKFGERLKIGGEEVEL
jgi:mRNA-degrading endonuclease RelE of RelBE toxin-antitoxin system